jgi:O-antigen ligase
MKALRIGLCLLLAFSVLAFGAVQVWSESLLEIGAALLFLFWAWLAYRSPEPKISWNPLHWPLLGFIGIGLLQLLFHTTAYAFLTRIEVLKLAAYFLFFFLLGQAFRTRADLSMLAWFVVLFCFVVSLLAIIQHFTSGGEIYWIVSVGIDGDPWGPYVNRNHFAGFVELTVPVGLALLVFRGLRRDLFPLMTLLAIVPLSAMVLSSSRGGIVSSALEIGVLALLVRNQRALHGTRVAVVALVAAVALLFISWVGASRAVERFSTLSPHDTSLARRVSMFRGAAHIFFDHPIKGCGLGTLIAVYPRYETAYDGRVVEHVHNDYIETLAETGLLGGFFGLIFLGTLYRQARRNFTAEQAHFSQALHAGAIVAISGLLLHSFVDFNLQIPANAMLFLLQAFFATSPPLPSQAPRQHANRPISSPIGESGGALV